jgi:hypothetical protein
MASVIKKLRELEAKATEVAPAPSVLRERTADGRIGDCRVWSEKVIGQCVAVFHGPNGEATGRAYIASRSALPALLAVAEAAVELRDGPGDMDPLFGPDANLIKALAALEAVKL